MNMTLHDLHVRLGAAFVDDFGWQAPARYGAADDEYRRACEAAALFERSHHGKIELAGSDAAFFLQNLSSNDVKGLAAGACCEAFLATAKARLVSYLLICRLEPDSIWLDPGPGQGERVLKHLDHYLISEQVELKDWTGEMAQFHLAGPESVAVLSRALQQDLTTLEVAHTLRVKLPTGDAIQVRRRSPLSVPGFDLVCSQTAAEKLVESLQSAGATWAGLEAYHALRIEAGTPIFGVDIDENNLAMEVGLTQRAISYTKGCFLGQEPIVRARDLGHVNWSFRGLRIADDVVSSAPGSKLFRDGKEVGRVTSAARSPRSGAIALAFVRVGSNEPGTQLELERDGVRHAVEVSSLPFSA